MKARNLLLGLGVLITCLSAINLLTRAQTTTPLPPRNPANLDERVNTLDSRMKAVEEKSDRADLQQEYLEQIQKQYEAYYEKAFNTQVIIVTVITLVIGLVGKFGVDNIVQSKLTEKSSELRTEFSALLDRQLEVLKQENAAQIKELEKSLREQIGGLERDLKIRSDFQFFYTRGLAAGTYKLYPTSRELLRNALAVYKSAKPRQIISKDEGARTTYNILWSIHKEDSTNFATKATAELANELYDGLEDELANVALERADFAAIIKERKKNIT